MLPLAHGLVQRTDLPLPPWLFGWAAAIVLIASFAALAALWPQPRLERGTWRPLPGGALLGSRGVEIACGALGVALFVLVLWAGWFGEQGPQDNLAPTFILVIFWVGLVFASLLFGDVFCALNPWRAIGRAAGALRRGAPAPYPERLGRWPAALGLLGFTWIELVSGYGDQPRKLVLCALVYSAVTWGGMGRYGVEAWARNAEAFGVYFGLFARVSVFETRDRVVGRRPPLSGLARLDAGPGTVAVVLVMIGTVTFDGFSQGLLWKQDVGVWLNDLYAAFGADAATKLASTTGLLAGVAFVALFYRFAAGPGGGRAFVHSLVPIAAVYAMAHYFSYLVFQGQAVGYLASDPLGRGWDLFGTASSAIHYGVLTATATWYFQVAFVLCGHVSGLVLAHDRALVLYGHAKEAVRSQYWMLLVMVGFTSLALWLLLQANK